MRWVDKRVGATGVMKVSSHALILRIKAELVISTRNPSAKVRVEKRRPDVVSSVRKKTDWN